MTTSALWLRRALWLGIVIDWVRGVPAVFAPDWTLTVLGQRGSTSPGWVAFASLLTVLLSLFYIPGALDPYRYAVSAWLAVLVRPCAALFFLVLYSGLYPAYGMLDAVLFLVQAPLLYLTMRGARLSQEVAR